MHDHTGHNPDQSAKPDSSTKKTQEKPAQPDPHAGHEMEKSDKAGSPPKGHGGK